MSTKLNFQLLHQIVGSNRPTLTASTEPSKSAQTPQQTFPTDLPASVAQKRSLLHKCPSAGGSPTPLFANRWGSKSIKSSGIVVLHRAGHENTFISTGTRLLDCSWMHRRMGSGPLFRSLVPMGEKKTAGDDSEIMTAIKWALFVCSRWLTVLFTGSWRFLNSTNRFKNVDSN